MKATTKLSKHPRSEEISSPQCSFQQPARIHPIHGWMKGKTAGAA
jgi:hypothetical protein